MRLKLTLSYAGVILLAGTLLLAVVWVFLLRYVPDGIILTTGNVVPNRTDLLRAFRPAATAALAFLLVLGLVGGWILAGRMLAPLVRITEAARTAADGTLSHRIRLPGRRDELRDLADTFDTMLDRLEAHVGEQQRFAANASHELRTPLAIMQTMLDVARTDPGRDAAADLERLQAVNTRAIQLTEALLLLSRAGHRSFATEVVDLSLLAEEAAETLLPLAEEQGVTIEVSGEVAPTVGSSALLLQMVTNLVHNAVVHNVSTAGGDAVAGAVRSVWVTTTVGRGGAVVAIENTGEPVDPHLVSTLTEPFQRGVGRARSGSHAGAGLGLAIVRSIVEAHDGALALSSRDGGGLRVVVSLPDHAGGPAVGAEVTSRASHRSIRAPHR